MAESKGLKLKVSEALPKDLGRGLARLDPADMARLGLEVGDIVSSRASGRPSARPCRPTRITAGRLECRLTASPGKMPGRHSTSTSRSARPS